MNLELPDNLSDEAVWDIFCAIMDSPEENLENAQLLPRAEAPAVSDRIETVNAGDGLKVVLVRYAPAGYSTPARSQILGSIQWSHVT